MLKPDSLRQAIAGRNPDLAANPDRLDIFIDEGRIAARASADTLGFEYRYRLNLLITDFAADPNRVFMPLMAWISRNQRELLESYASNNQAVAFEVEDLGGGKVDLEIKLELSERVRVTPREGGGYECEYLAEPDVDGPDGGGRTWELYLQDEFLGSWVDPA